MADVPSTAGIPDQTVQTETPDDYQHITPEVGAAAEKFGQAVQQTAHLFGQIQTDNVSNKVIQSARQLTDQYLSLRGEDAINARPQYETKLNQLFDQGAAQLSTPDQLEYYNSSTRSYQDKYFGGLIATHANQSLVDHAKSVNDGLFQNGIDTIGGKPNDPTAFNVGSKLIIQSKIKQLQLEGNAGDPELVKQAVTNGLQQSWATRILGVGAQDPTAALQMADQNQALLGDDYYKIYDALRPRADEQTSKTFVDGQITNIVNPPPAPVQPAPLANQPLPPPATAKGATAAPKAQGAALTAPSPPQPITIDSITNAIYGVESGNKDNVPTSVTGAVGPAQIEPATFKQFANPGENINVPSDNRAVAARAISYYAAQYNNDPGRVAVAYFSGPGNVSPPGSPLPYIHNATDPTGASTANYVASVYQKLGMNAPPSVALQQQKQSVFDAIDNSNMTDSQKILARQYATERINAQAVEDGTTTQALAKTSDASAAAYTQQYWDYRLKGTPIPPEFVQQVADDPNLQFGTKNSLMGMMVSELDNQGNKMDYGAGYKSALDRVLAPYGPGKIMDNTSILDLYAKGDITLAGANSLIDTLKATQAGVDQDGIAQMRSGWLTYAKSQLSFEDDNSPYPIKDPKGQAIFNSQFIPQFESMWNAWVKAGNDPAKFPIGQVNDLIHKLRPQSDLNADAAAAGVNLGGGPSPNQQVNPGYQFGQAQPKAAPMPAPPAQVLNADAWKNAMNDPPVFGKNQMTSAQWAGALSRLMADPKNMEPLFDAQFGLYGVPSAADIVKELSRKPFEGIMRPGGRYGGNENPTQPPAVSNGAQ